MTQQTILFLHGFISSALSTKARYLGERLEALSRSSDRTQGSRMAFQVVDFNPTPQDFTYMTITGRIDRLRQYVLDRQFATMSLVGSSLGGLVGLHYAHRFGGVERMLLLSPALSWLSGHLSAEELERWEEAGTMPVFHPAFGRAVPLRYDLQVDGRRYREPVPPPVPITIIHGRSDETVPIDQSRAYASTYPDDVDLVEVEASHDINEHLDLIWTHVRAFLLESDG